MSEKPAAEKQSGAESPTTARELDFDDEPQETVATTTPGDKPTVSPNKKVSFQEDAPPPKPPRPMSPQAMAEATLIEAFPSMDVKVVKAVLVASGGNVEPAFNALLGMSDPDFKTETPPPQPPRPTAAQRQLESDEQYARQLAAHYQATSSHEGFGSRSRGDPTLSRQRQESGLKPSELYDDRERSFLDDDLPEIRENIKKGFLETQSKVNQWISDFKKKIDGEDDDDDDDIIRPSGPRQQRTFGSTDSGYGQRRSGDVGRRSGDRERYDADPKVLGDDFSALELRDSETSPKPRSTRPLANPDLFKPTPTAPQSGPVDEVEALYSNPSTNRQPSPGAGKNKKWQPLTTIEPQPEAEEHDPFSLGDSDDDHDAKTKDLRAEDSERLKKAAAKSTVEPPESGAKLKPAETSGSAGTRDKAAEELVLGKQ
jgi:hypothetical protein